MKITKTLIAEAVSASNEGFTHCEIVQTHKFRTSTLASGLRRTGCSYLQNILLLNKLSVCIRVHLWFFNTIRSSL
jgi:hypothetical protein